MPLRFFVFADRDEVVDHIKDFVFFEHQKEVCVRQGAMAVLEESKGCSIRRPVVPRVDKNLLKHFDNVKLEHILADVFILNVACQVKNDSNHQVSEPTVVDFVSTSLRHSSLERNFKLLDNNFKDVMLHHEQGHLLNALFVRCQIKKHGGSWVLDSNHVVFVLKKSIAVEHNLAQLLVEHFDALWVACTQLEYPRYSFEVWLFNRVLKNHAHQNCKHTCSYELKRKRIVDFSVLEVKDDCCCDTEQLFNHTLLFEDILQSQ